MRPPLRDLRAASCPRRRGGFTMAEMLVVMAIITILGAALHVVATVVVIFNSARLVRFGEELHAEEEKPEPTFRPGAAPEPVPAG